MPPKVKITKETIIEATLSLIRSRGHEALAARELAAELHCSTQPIFSNFSSMEEVRAEAIRTAEALYNEYTEREIQSNLYPPYKASGMAYIRFALEEKELFQLLFMRDRTAEEIPEETELGKIVVSMVETNTGLDHPMAQLFHMEMWAFVHGLATMVATDYLTLDMNLVCRMITDVYHGLRHRFEKELSHGSHQN